MVALVWDMIIDQWPIDFAASQALSARLSRYFRGSRNHGIPTHIFDACFKVYMPLPPVNCTKD